MEANYQRWGIADVITWKFIPVRLGGGIEYIQNYKDGWIVFNRTNIKLIASQYGLPEYLLGGIAWIEVGGDPYFIDFAAFFVRSFDWMGPAWVDKNLTLTKDPLKTSFGSVSIQLSVVAETMGFNVNDLSYSQQTSLITDLQSDIFNLSIVARHVIKIINHYYPGVNPRFLSDEQIRITGAAYNRGMSLTIEQLKKNTSYGDFILKSKERINRLLNKL